MKVAIAIILNWPSQQLALKAKANNHVHLTNPYNTHTHQCYNLRIVCDACALAVECLVLTMIHICIPINTSSKFNA